ncbi:MAG: DUF3606 domain-containing protein [Chitinophagaceae bacterium]
MTVTIVSWCHPTVSFHLLFYMINSSYMSQDFPMTRPKDTSKINVNDIGEMIWWSYQLSTNPEKIISIVHKVGIAAEEVRKALHPKTS